MGNSINPRLEGHAGDGDGTTGRAQQVRPVAETGGVGRVENPCDTGAGDRCGSASEQGRNPVDGRAESLRPGNWKAGTNWGNSDGSTGRVADATQSRPPRRGSRAAQPVAGEASGSAGYATASPPQTGWDNPDWLLCRDGRWRPVESGTFPLVDGLPTAVDGAGAIGRVGTLKGAGNAIVPQVAAEIIRYAVLDNQA